MSKRKLLARPCASLSCDNIARGRHYCAKCAHDRYAAANPEREVFRNLRYNASRRKIKFTLTFSWFINWLQAEGKGYLERRGRRKNDLTLDRVDPRLGYANGNLQVLTRAANTAKAFVDNRRYGGSWTTVDPWDERVDGPRPF